jgi:hypothetical protein
MRREIACWPAAASVLFNASSKGAWPVKTLCMPVTTVVRTFAGKHRMIG